MTGRAILDGGRRLLWSVMLVGAAWAPGAAAEPREPRSGYHYLAPENQRLQDDDFANPGLIWVEQGAALFARDCRGCHTPAALADVRLRYPAFDPSTGALINLEQRINHCRTERMQAAALPWESRELLSLGAWFGHLARGRVLEMTVDEQTRPFLEAGEAFFRRRRGQLNMACSHCHVDHVGQRLRGEVISEGHLNGYPAYRQVWESLGSTHRLFRWCNEAVRAEPYPFGAPEYVNLEYYLNWRGRGLVVETPAVRR
jgi:sulfur-oxidizing protein SoxA